MNENARRYFSPRLCKSRDASITLSFGAQARKPTSRSVASCRGVKKREISGKGNKRGGLPGWLLDSHVTRRNTMGCTRVEKGIGDAQKKSRML